MALEQEMQTYRDELPRLLTGGAGKFVLIHKAEVSDLFDTYQDAIKEGYARFKFEPFLVQQVEAVEQAQFLTRDIHLCRT